MAVFSGFSHDFVASDCVDVKQAAIKQKASMTLRYVRMLQSLGALHILACKSVH